ncbi:MAG TPA: O-GlcNAc transferase, partial [Candidatus Saccharimonadia bacterium]|nr:O-GlcNAc transferase [Candidatus Saccharimonadia bacterium]
MPAGLPVRDGIGHGAAADGGRLRAWLPGLLLVVTALAAYYPSLHGKFIFDDGPQIGEADSYGFWSIWFEPTCLYQYYPLANTTLCLDWRWWGEWMLPYHLQNVLLHGLSAVLFWKLLRRLQVPGAWLAAAIFTLHPMMVESVAWISERKNVLTQAFYLGAFLQYGRCVDYWREPGGTVKRSAWVLALILFVVALCSKVTAFSFPPAILLVCWWK